LFPGQLILSQSPSPGQLILSQSSSPGLLCGDVDGNRGNKDEPEFITH